MTNNITHVCNIKKVELNKRGYIDFIDWAKDKNHVYIGRNMSFYVKGTTESIWHNPFSVKKLNNKNKSDIKNENKTYMREESLDRYREYIKNRPDLLAQLCTLKGKELGCWCKPLACHGDILVELIKEYCN